MKNKLSFTKLSTYNECGLKYDLHYNQMIRPIAAKSPLIFGNSVDEALNTLIETKDLNKALNRFEDLWNKQPVNGKEMDLKIPGVVQFSKSDVDEDLLEVNNIEGKDNPAWFSLLLKGELIIKAYYEKILPRFKSVKAIQTPVKIENQDGDTINGKLDLIVEWEDGRVILMDNKTTSVIYDKNSAKNSEQLNLYYYLEKDNYKLDAVGFITLSKKINWEYKKTCNSCEHIFNSNHTKCINMVEGKRCNGKITLQKIPSIDVDVIINNIESGIQDKTIETFDKVNEGIINNIFEMNRNSCIGKFGKCTYFDYCNKSSMNGLIKLERKE